MVLGQSFNTPNNENSQKKPQQTIQKTEPEKPQSNTQDYINNVGLFLEKYTNFTPQEINYFISTSPDSTKNTDTIMHVFNGNIGKHIREKFDSLFKELNIKSKELEDCRIKYFSIHTESEKAKLSNEQNKNKITTLELENSKLSTNINKARSSYIIASTESANLKEKNQNLVKCIKEKDKLYEIFKNNLLSYKKQAVVFSDFVDMQYALTIKYLRMKKPHANKTADRIERDCKNKLNIFLNGYKELQYKIEDFLSTHPVFEDYFYDNKDDVVDKELQEIANIEDDEKRIIALISKEKYDSLDENTRNQLALENYITKRKSRWAIGRDYEMFVGYEYANNGWTVLYHGILKGFEDFGRDLIATKGNTTHIVQCKYWSKKKIIHEKHIFQLFGSTIAYKIENKTENDAEKEIIPIFMTSTTLSDQAKQFADYLGVKYIENKELGNFPRIKCNISKKNKNKIYHLPSDQQYDNTIIEPEYGEFYAHTVKEAVEKGFRRAYYWHGLKNKF
ncbi:hypothetical protein NO1_0282 [Candidatus Termititenax aidoneus]|uniref:Restriction endonuclease type IV Mrr domain-containing protein n=1 Tax=Termititenax aidoneus TaxID=2218524 RepID=A0A388T9A0_TERA1|nr:hypothetical protein NO1_0282 [Candidatus Termititenax aidoneus]